MVGNGMAPHAYACTESISARGCISKVCGFLTSSFLAFLAAMVAMLPTAGTSKWHSRLLHVSREASHSAQYTCGNLRDISFCEPKTCLMRVVDNWAGYSDRGTSVGWSRVRVV